jgi:hypothetical protein
MCCKPTITPSPLFTILVGDCGTVLVAASGCVGDCVSPVPGYEWQDKSCGWEDASISTFSSESPAGGVVPKPDISSGIASQLTLQKSIYEGTSISKLQIVIEKKRMEIMTYKQHLFFNIISIHI